MEFYLDDLKEFLHPLVKSTVEYLSKRKVDHCGPSFIMTLREVVDTELLLVLYLSNQELEYDTIKESQVEFEKVALNLGNYENGGAAVIIQQDGEIYDVHYKREVVVKDVTLERYWME